MADDDALTPEEKAAKKAADDQEKIVMAALLAALLALRPQMTTVTYWLPDTWADFRDAAGRAIEPALDAFDRAGRALWMGYDSLDGATLEMQRQLRDKFVTEISEATRRGIDKIMEWGRVNGIAPEELDKILSKMAGLNGNQIGAILSDLSDMREAGSSDSLMDRMVASEAKKATKDRAGNLAGDVLWDAVMLGLVAGGMQEARATNTYVVKTWWTRRDERVCSVCGPLHGVTVPINSAFPGGLMAPRAHADCRCGLHIGLAKRGGF